MTIDFDPELMADTAIKMLERIHEDLHSLEQTHGASFCASLAGNIGVQLLTKVIASVPSSDERNEMAKALMIALAHNLRGEIAFNEASEVIAKMMGKGDA